MKQIANITVRMRCEDCGHEQEVTSAAAFEEADGRVHGYFGSRYDHCDKCDGLPQPVDQNHERS